MYLLIYDIAARNDPHGIRVRLVRSLRRGGAFKLQQSAWLLERFTEDILRIIDEFRTAGGCVKVTEWLPRTLEEIMPEGKRRQRRVSIVPLGGEPIAEGWHRRVKRLLEAAGYSAVVLPVGESAWSELNKKEREASAGRGAEARKKPISRALDEVALSDTDGMILLNSGRSAQSGMVYVSQTIADTALLKGMTSFPLVQLERAGKDDGIVLAWSESGAGLASKIAGDLGLSVIKPSLEAKIVTREGGREIRQLRYAKLGDEIIVNGHSVGICLAEQVYLVGERGRLVDIMGGKIRRREAQKLRFGSIADITVKTVSRLAR